WPRQGRKSGACPAAPIKMKKIKPALILLMKLLVSAGLLVFFYTPLHPARFLGPLAAADFSFVALALVVYFLAQLASAFRWTILARPLGFDNRFKDFSFYYFIGVFFNLVAPRTVGGDVTRFCYLAGDGEKDRQKGWATATVPVAVSV